MSVALAERIYKSVCDGHGGWSFATIPLHFRRAGEEVLGVVSCSRPDWRQGHEHRLQQCARVRQDALVQYRQSPIVENLGILRQARRHHSRMVVRQLKQEWWQGRLSVMAEASRTKDPGTLYGEARQLGRLLKAQGLCRRPLVADPLLKTKLLADHFSQVLRVDRPVDEDLLSAVEALPQPLPTEHWGDPTWEEFLQARSKLASGKAPDGSGVHAELLKALPTDGVGLKILQAIFELTTNFWRGHLTDRDLKLWHTSILFPLYKGKGDYDLLDNWRGIVLLDIFSKLVSRILNARLLVLADLVCSDNELGYRKDRGTVDACFLLRRLMESWRTTDPVTPVAPDSSDSLYLLFVDLQKAFDAVPRTLLWNLLSTKAHVPGHVILAFVMMVCLAKLSRCLQACVKGQWKALPCTSFTMVFFYDIGGRSAVRFWGLSACLGAVVVMVAFVLQPASVLQLRTTLVLRMRNLQMIHWWLTAIGHVSVLVLVFWMSACVRLVPRSTR